MNDDDSNHRTISDILKGTRQLKGIRNSINSNNQNELPLEQFNIFDRKSNVS